ncbi:sensor domain-containing diguanylate cyclase [Bacillus sp. KH172YL63]|uniref:sensor domain-containing diguanylate cyclase n=1 Tax=Bacillus sp. KH172YL63 TaxID=2709784 RepID=UPI0013E51C0E|nr:diguanylate cyclase [Bacillus sp. KH172YL63]BCB05821.1 diguanylate cyclase [Bacillus sp. KH172YL63]
MSVRLLLSGSFALLILVLSVALSYTISFQASNEVKKEIGSSLSSIAFQTSDHLERFMWARKGEIDILSQLDVIKDPDDHEEVYNLLSKLKESFPSFSWVGLTDEKGTVLSSTDHLLEGADISSRPVFQEALEETFIGDVHDAKLLADKLPNPTGEPIQFVDISTPIENHNGDFIGVLATHLSWEWSKEVEKAILDSVEQKELEQLQVFIISRKDQIVLLGPKEMVGKPLTLASIDSAQDGVNNYMIEKWPDGQHYVTGFHSGKGYLDYEGLGWTVLVRQPEDVAFGAVHDLRKNIMWIGTSIACMFAVIGWFLAGFISKPLQRISNASIKLRNGEDVSIPQIKGIEEIHMLSSSLHELITSLLHTEQKLGKMEELAQHDKLTGLPNRIALELFLPEATLKAKKENVILSFLFLDLDGFKAVNDSLGHHAGDLLLKKVADRIRNCMSDDSRPFRIGGDEFLVVIDGPQEKVHEMEIEISGEIIAKLNEPFELDGEIVQIGCSIGGASWPQADPDPQKVIRYADLALYESKREGKNRCTFHQLQPV